MVMSLGESTYLVYVQSFIEKRPDFLRETVQKLFRDCYRSHPGNEHRGVKEYCEKHEAGLVKRGVELLTPLLTTKVVEDLQHSDSIPNPNNLTIARRVEEYLSFKLTLVASTVAHDELAVFFNRQLDLWTASAYDSESLTKSAKRAAAQLLEASFEETGPHKGSKRQYLANILLRQLTSIRCGREPTDRDSFTKNALKTVKAYQKALEQGPSAPLDASNIDQMSEQRQELIYQFVDKVLDRVSVEEVIGGLLRNYCEKRNEPELQRFFDESSVMLCQNIFIPFFQTDKFRERLAEELAVLLDIYSDESLKLLFRDEKRIAPEKCGQPQHFSRREVCRVIFDTQVSEQVPLCIITTINAFERDLGRLIDKFLERHKEKE